MYRLGIHAKSSLWLLTLFNNLKGSIVSNERTRYPGGPAAVGSHGCLRRWMMISLALFTHRPHLDMTSIRVSAALLIHSVNKTFLRRKSDVSCHARQDAGIRS
jgi:hypothetical protein